MGNNIAFVVLSVLVVVGALVCFGTKKLLHGAIGLLVSLLGTAGLFFMAKAEFLAVAQIMVYAGGILVIILFGIMITQYQNEDSTKNRNWGAIFVTVGLSIVGILAGIGISNAVTWNLEPTFSLQKVGNQLLTLYLFPFEASIIMVLAVLVGGSIIAFRKIDR